MSEEESTTPDLVELTRRAFEVVGSHDVDAIMNFFGPGAIWDLNDLGLGMFEGVAAIRGLRRFPCRAQRRSRTFVLPGRLDPVKAGVHPLLCQQRLVSARFHKFGVWGAQIRNAPFWAMR